MRITRLPFAGVVLLAVLPISPAGPPAKDAPKLPPPAPGTVDFARDVRPLFEKNCIKCHSAAKHRGGLRLDDGKAALEGGDSGPVIVPGKGAESRLLRMVAGLDPDAKMPPEGPGLGTAEVAKLRAWIDQGAKWGDTGSAVVGPKPKSDHWAFQPIKDPAPPAVKNGGWVRNPIDRFILARLEKEGIAPSPEADRVTLIRRVTFDLIGLPPTPQEVDDFLKDSRPDAYERLVDRLLNSPHYGERWGRHWLDAARYADSDGFEKDTGRPWAWRYRNWVIDALNRDLPYDRFTVEQLAGDLLPNATLEQKIATGFHRNTLTNKEGGVDQEQFRVEQVVDRVSTTAKVFLGVTLNCTQCHDHKYDPFTQREFYQFLAFFNSDQEVDVAAPLPGEAERLRPKVEAFQRKKAELTAALESHKKLLPALQEKWEKTLRAADVAKLPANVAAVVKLAPAKRDAKQKKALADYFAKQDKQLAALTKAVADHERTAPGPSKAPTIALGPGRKTNVMIRGDFLRKGVEVRPGTPAVLPALPTTESPTRLDLARWLVSADNPLTARVAVNWMWQKYFGRGIVATPEDFGTQGEKPSHPELLDWLAREMMRQKWSLKAMHKLIVTSATYRQASKARPDLKDRDPYNVLLAHQVRLRMEAEIVRDNALAASGLLVRTVGGPSVRPPQPPGISELTYAGAARWVESTGPDRYRRGLYTWFQRTSPYPMLMTFDSPDSNVCVVRRERSNTPLQALTLLNDVVFVECAQALGKRIVEERPGGVEGRVAYAFRLCLAREPSVAEKERLVGLYGELHRLAKSNPEAAARLVGKYRPANADVAEAAAWAALARALLNLDEFVTRE